MTSQYWPNTTIPNLHHSLPPLINVLLLAISIAALEELLRVQKKLASVIVVYDITKFKPHFWKKKHESAT